MSLFPRLRAGLIVGLLVGLNANVAPTGPALLADFDFSAPVVQSFPTTAAELATLLGDAAATPSYIWDCQEASGNLVDEIAAEALVPDSGPLQGQTAAGLWDGSSYTARNAVEFADGSAQSFDGSTSLLDVTTGDMSILAVFRMPADALGDMIGKIETGSDGWRMHPNTSGRVSLVMGDSIPVSVTHTYTMNADHLGQWVCVIGHINGTADEARIFGSGGAAAVASDISTLGSMTNSDPFKIGENRTTSFGGQIAYVAAFEGAASNALYALGQTAVDNFWQHATDPTGLLTTQSRASLISVLVAADAVCHFAPNTLPIGFNAAFSDANKLGLFCNSAVTNLLPFSEDINNSGWSVNNVSKAPNQGDSPAGFRDADTVTATAANGSTFEITPTTDSSVNTFSFWVKRNGGSDVGGRIRLQDVANATFVVDDAFTATSTWQRISGTGTMGVGTTNSSAVIQIDTNTESILVWGAQLELGDGAGAYIRTSGASASLVNPNYVAVTAAGLLIRAETGEMEAVAVMAKVGNVQYLATASEGGSNLNLRSLRVDATPESGFAVYQDSGGVTADIAGGAMTADTEHTLVGRWSADANLAIGAEAQLLLDDVSIGTDADIGDFAEDINQVRLGDWRSVGVGPANAFLQRFRIWDGERAA